MNPLSHLSYPALFFVLAAKLFQIDYSFFDLLVLMFFSVLPDFGLLFFSLIRERNHKFSFSDFLTLFSVSVLPDFALFPKKLIRKEEFNQPPKHHGWSSHRPITYFPLLVLLFFYLNLKLFLVCFGLYSHLILDTLLRRGIMWLYPFSKRFFGLGLLKEEFEGCKGLDCFKLYKKTIFYKIEVLSFVALLIVLVSFWL